MSRSPFRLLRLIRIRAVLVEGQPLLEIHTLFRSCQVITVRETMKVFWIVLKVVTALVALELKEGGIY